jgi:hypothetical protein
MCRNLRQLVMSVTNVSDAYANSHDQEQPLVAAEPQDRAGACDPAAGRAGS